MVGASSGGSPAGSVTAFAGTTGSIPAGWLLCDGTPLNSTNYPSLYAAIGIAWGNGSNGSGTDFNLPDMRGYFLRGVSHSTTRDLDRNSRTPNGYGNKVQVGSSQSDAIRNITGRTAIGEFTETIQNGAFYGRSTYSNGSTIGTQSGGTSDHYTTFDASRVVPTGGDNRPKNVYVNYIIKY